MELFDLGWFGVWYVMFYIAPTHRWVREGIWFAISWGISVDKEILKDSWYQLVSLIEEAKVFYNARADEHHLMVLFEDIYQRMQGLNAAEKVKALKLLEEFK
jgi:hypothetical protein